MTLQDRILELLKGRSQHKPLIGDDLLAKTGADPDEVNDALNDLQGRGALNRVEITRGDRTFTALWPTGLVPRNLSWKEERNNGKGMMGAQLAHNVQQAAEDSRQPQKPAPTPVPTPVPTPTPPSPPAPLPLTGEGSHQETPMVRVARPAQITEPVAPEKLRSPHARRDQQMNTGPVQTAILAVLKAGGVLDVETIFNLLVVPTTKGSCGKVLETLAKRGEIEASIRFHNKRHRRYYCMPGTDRAAAPACSEPLCSELPGNLDTLRRIGADEHDVDAAKMVKPVDATPAIRTHKPPHTPTNKPPHEIRSSNRAHFAFYDDGVLEIFQDDSTVTLPPAEVARMVAFLGRIAA